MQQLKLVCYGDPVLKQRAAGIQRIDGEISDLAADMIKVMDAHAGMGLAATQIGVSKRLITVRLEVDDEPITLVNPEITFRFGVLEKDEGCLSLPGISVPIKRAERVRITGIGLDGETVELEAEGLTARAFQHEADHIDGILISDRITKKQKKEIAEHLERIRTGEIQPDS